MNRTQVYSPAAPADRREHLESNGKKHINDKAESEIQKSRKNSRQDSQKNSQQNIHNTAYYDKNPKRTPHQTDRDNNPPLKTKSKDREYHTIGQRPNKIEKISYTKTNDSISIRRTAAYTVKENIPPRNGQEIRNRRVIHNNDRKMVSASPQTQNIRNGYNTSNEIKKSRDYQDYIIRQNKYGSESDNQKQIQTYSHSTVNQNSYVNNVKRQYPEAQSSQNRSHKKNIYSESKSRQKKTSYQNQKSDNIKTHRYTKEELRMLRAAEIARKTAEEQMMRERRQRQKEKQRLNRVRKKNERRKSTKRFVSSLALGIVNSIPNFLLFLIVFLSLGVISSLGIFASLHINLSDASKTIGFNITDTDETKIYSTTLSAKEYRYGNIIYLNMNDFAGRFGFITVGTADELKYISGENENYILNISVGSSEITVNKMQFRLTAPVIKNGDNILIPLEFFKIYLKGISVNFDDEKYAVTMVRDIAEYNVTVADGKTPVYEPVGFIPSFQETTPNIPEDSLSQDILDATDPTPKPVVTYIDTDGDGIADTAVDSATGEPIPEMNPTGTAE